jgi:hypothetical protein
MKITYKFYKGTPFIFYFFLFGGESRKKFLVLKKESSLAAWRVYHHVFIIVLLPLSESREREDMAIGNQNSKACEAHIIGSVQR